MWLMLQQDSPDDFVIATGETHSVREFCQLAFDEVGLDWQEFVKIDAGYYRPSEVDLLLGDARKAKALLGWEPTVSFPQLVKMMVDADLQIAAREKAMVDARFVPRAPEREDVLVH